MIQTYYRLVKNGLKTIEQVPENIRALVQELLDQDETDK